MKGSIQSVLTKLRKHKWVPHLLVGLVYLFFTFYYMGPSITNCNSTLYGFGDNTAGPIWRYSVSSESPLWGYQSVSNYPIGEDLYSPVNYSGTLQYTLFWGLSKVAGPICGYNLVNIIGFISSALVMYGFIFVVTKRRWVAILAGYAVSFSPYYQMKLGGHPSYGYQALLIGLVWSFYNLIKKRRKRDALYLALLFSACVYFDPYFTLLAGVSLASLGLAWIVLTSVQFKRKTIDKLAVIKQLRLFALSIGMMLVLLAPMLYIAATKINEINSSVASSRGNVLFEARACSNLPHEYVLPFALHFVFGKAFGTNNFRDLIDDISGGFTCGLGEDSIGISIAVLFVTATGVTVIAWELLNKRRVRFKTLYDKKLLMLGLVFIMVAALVMALPPLKIAGIPTPSYVLLDITPTWRTLTRFYVLVNLATVSFFALILAYYAHHFRKHKKLLGILLAIIFLVVFVEYQAFRPFGGNRLSTFNYDKDVPQAYQWLKEQDDINEIAEYPLERAGGESNAMAYYLSMQVYHGKKLFNGNNSSSEDELLKSSIKDLSDRMTIDTLYSLGIDTVVIHGVDEATIRSIPELEILKVFPQSGFNILSFTPLVKNDITIIAKLTGSRIDRRLAFNEKFVRNANIIRSSVDWEYEVINDGRMFVVPVDRRQEISEQPGVYCFAVRMAGDDDSAKLSIAADGKVVKEASLSSAYHTFRIDAKNDIVLSNSLGYNMRVKDLGCRD